MPDIVELSREFQMEADTTRVLLERVPATQLRWKPHQKSMSLGQLALHVATVPGAIATMSVQAVFDVKTAIPSTEAATVEEILAAHDRSVDEVDRVLRSTDDADLASPWRMVDGQREVMTLSRGDLLRSLMLNHWYHHRGQLTVYLRQLDVAIPPIYGPTADENPFVHAST